jgi:hypothetical protein
LGRAARWGTALADGVRVAYEDDLIRRLKQFVAQLGHAHADTARTGRALRESQRLITRQHEEVRVIDTRDETPALPGRSRVHTRRVDNGQRGKPMRKRVMTGNDPPFRTGRWLDADTLAQVEVSSEDPAYPIEAALTEGTGLGWRASQAGKQVIRVLFDEPRRLRRIRLVFHEANTTRTQEVVLRWSSDGGESYRDVVRQQYNFSPPGTSDEVEDYRVDLDGVTSLEVGIVPDIRGGEACASLKELRLA